MTSKLHRDPCPSTCHPSRTKLVLEIDRHVDAPDHLCDGTLVGGLFIRLPRARTGARAMVRSTSGLILVHLDAVCEQCTLVLAPQHGEGKRRMGCLAAQQTATRSAEDTNGLYMHTDVRKERLPHDALCDRLYEGHR